MAVTVSFLPELLATVRACKRLLIKVDSQVVFQAAHLCEMMFAILAFQNLIGPPSDFVVVVYLDVMIFILDVLFLLRDLFAMLAHHWNLSRHLIYLKDGS